MRVLFFTELHSSFGGSERWVLNVTRELSRLGVKVIKLFVFPEAKSSLLLDYLDRVLSLLSLSKDLLKKLDCDIIHTVKMFTPTIVRLFSQKPIVATFHDVYGFKFSVFNKGPFTGSLRSLIEFLSIKTPINLYIVPSKGTALKLLRYNIPLNKIRVVGVGVNIDSVDSVKTKKSSQPEIVFIGRLVKHKHPEQVIKLAKMLNVKAHIIGGGPLYNWLRAYASKIKADVIFHGYINERRKYEILKKSWVLVLPSEMEGFGIVLAEALAAYTPVVVYDSLGPRDIVIDNVNGYLVPINDFEGMHEKVKALLDDNKLRRRMGFNGRKIVEEKYTWRHVAERVLAAYKHLY